MKFSEHKKFSFALCLIQGFAGGVLGGFTYLIVSFREGTGTDLSLAIEIAPWFLLAGSILGSIKATVMWGFFRLIGRPLSAFARVAISSIVSTLIVAFPGLYFDFSEDQLTGLLVLALSLGTPVALMVGSSVKPWQLFTFGSIAAGEVDHRTGSRSIFGTIGSLPLRFLGIGMTAYLLLRLVCEMQPVNTVPKVVKTILLFAVWGVYPAFSAYVTFRSPRKIVLVAIAVIINSPVALMGLFFYSINSKAYWLGDTPLIISMICGSFVVAWLIFLVARLSVRISPDVSLSIITNKSIAAAPNLDHECLGSRFAAWERVA